MKELQQLAIKRANAVMYGTIEEAYRAHREYIAKAAEQAAAKRRKEEGTAR